jgi:hypothetical protein
LRSITIPIILKNKIIGASDSQNSSINCSSPFLSNERLSNINIRSKNIIGIADSNAEDVGSLLSACVINSKLSINNMDFRCPEVSRGLSPSWGVTLRENISNIFPVLEIIRFVNGKSIKTACCIVDSFKEDDSWIRNILVRNNRVVITLNSSSQCEENS